MSDPCSTFISLIVPAFNEEKRILPTLEKAYCYFNAKKFKFEIIVVDDGSTDATAAICQKAKEGQENLHLIRLPLNRGKGFAVKTGIEHAQGEYILFADADNSTPIEELEKFLPHFSPQNLLVGSRFWKPELIERRQPWYRLAISRLANYLIRLLVVKKVRDTQCGFKVIYCSVASRLARIQKIERFGFDIEYLALAQRMGIAVREIPVRWINSPASRIRPFRDAAQTFIDLLKIRIFLWQGIYQKAMVHDL